MRLQLTIVLILLNIALAGVIFYLEKEPASGQAFDHERRLVLPPGYMDEADRLEIEGRKLAKSWVLARAQNRWQITQPVNWPANYYAVNRLFNELKFLEWENRFSVKDVAGAGRSLADYGLAEPKAVLTIGKGADKLALKLGEVTEVGNNLYLLSPDNRDVFVVKRELLDGITLNLEDLRSANIFDLPIFEVRSLSLQITQPDNLKVRLAREGEQWTFEAPIRAAADGQQVTAALNLITAAKIASFYEPDPAKQGLVNPALRLTLEGGSRRQTIMVGDVVPGQSLQRFAMLADNPTVFTVEAAPFDALRSAQESLREKKFVHFNPEALTAVEITASGRSLTLQKLETGVWQALQKDAAGNPGNWPADAGVVKGVMAALRNLEAVRFISDAPAAADLANYGFNDPQRRVSLKAAGAETALLVGHLAPAGNLLYAKMAEQPSVYLIHPDILAQCKVQALHYRQRVLWEQPQAATARKITLAETGVAAPLLEVEIDPAKENWETKLAADTEDRRKAVAELAGVARRLVVKEYLRDKFSEKFELDRETVLPWKYKYTATLNLPGGEAAKESKLELVFTERLGGGTQFGGSAEHNVIFSLPQKLIDALHTLTFRDKPLEPSLEPPPATAPAP